MFILYSDCKSLEVLFFPLSPLFLVFYPVFVNAFVIILRGLK